MSEMQLLKELSARCGNDPLQVQAAGGNTSLKQDGVMWIKASGTWLADSLTSNNFVPLDFEALSKALAADDPACESCLAFVRTDLNPSGLRPSIETSVHALMRQAVVVHVHCVDTIAWAIGADAEQALKAPLAGFSYAFIPYARPGRELAAAIAARITPSTDVLILQNHGLVVAAASVAEADVLLARVRAALRREVRPSGQPDLSKLAAECAAHGYRVATDAETHALATDPLCIKRALGKVYYPDHAIFLGVGVATDYEGGAPLVAREGLGVAIHHKAVRAIEPMGRCLADVLRRVGEAEALHALSEEQIGRLLNWDAEKYRQSLATH